LRPAGAFDALDSNSCPGCFAGSEAILAACQRSMSATVGRTTVYRRRGRRAAIMLPQVEPWLPAERLRREYDAIGFFLRPSLRLRHVLTLKGCSPGRISRA